jgi:hypothetical protein
MIHLHPVSGEQARFNVRAEQPLEGWSVGARPVLADAKTDFLNSLQRAWNNYVFAKKNA